MSLTPATRVDPRYTTGTWKSQSHTRDLTIAGGGAFWDSEFYATERPNAHVCHLIPEAKERKHIWVINVGTYLLLLESDSIEAAHHKVSTKEGTWFSPTEMTPNATACPKPSAFTVGWIQYGAHWITTKVFWIKRLNGKISFFYFNEDSESFDEISHVRTNYRDFLSPRCELGDMHLGILAYSLENRKTITAG